MIMTVTVPTALRRECTRCRRELPLSGIRLALRSIVLEYSCEPCKIVYGQEYRPFSGATAKDKADAALDAAFDRISS